MCDAMSWVEQLCKLPDCLLMVLHFSVAQWVAQHHSGVGEFRVVILWLEGC